MQKLYILVISLVSLSLFNSVFSQSVLNPLDPVINYDSTNKPSQPASNQIGKWVRTPSLSWNTASYKAYIYKGCAFRLKFPKTYNPTANDGKKYPMLVFFHGLGETGGIYDNEYQLYHGGDDFAAAVDNGTFDGYILCMQSQGFWGTNQYQYITDIIDYMVINNKLDPFRTSVNGLSAGGQGTWEMLINHPTYINAAVPMSSASTLYEDQNTVSKIKYTPIWHFQGGLDGSPAPYTSQHLRDVILAAGGNFKYTEYRDLGHGIWDRVWQEPDFYPFLLRGYSSNPWTLYGRTEFCLGDTINLTIGLAPGFDEYQWSKNGSIIAGATTNKITVKDTGTYTARVRRGSLWSDWSHIPAHIKIKDPTITPPINVSGLMSTAIPSFDGRNYVNLEVPDNGYTTYAWRKVGNSNVIGTNRILKVTQSGDYTVSITEQYGCSSIPSPVFHVTDANGVNAPDAAKSLIAFTLSNTQIELDWSDNPRPNYNETAFEIYRSLSSGGSYVFVGQVPADILIFTDNGLTPNVKYYYKVRAINNNGAAALSNEASVTTQSDDVPPTAPSFLRVTSTTGSTVSLQWNVSKDDVGIALYEIYVNGVKTYSTTQTSFNVNGLQPKQQFTFYVKAKDISGNYSPQSNLVNAATILQGLKYKYYEGLWNSLPDFNTLAFVKAGVSSNTDISPKNRNDQFGFLWEGYINIPVTGTYRFITFSGDGSKLWLSTYNASSTPLVNNDGLHGGKSVSSVAVTLQAGVYPISVDYFDQGGGQVMQLYWSCRELFGDKDKHLIADEYFKESYSPGGTAPTVPSALTAAAFSYNQIKLTWADNSNNETGFEVYRSASSTGPFSIVYTTLPNKTTYTDSALLPSKLYYYKILAVNQFGSSDSTAVASGTTSALPVAPAAPGSLSAIVQSSSQLKLIWTDQATDETGYTVYRSINNPNNFKQLASLPANSNNYVDSSLFAHIKYYYKINVTGIGGSTNSSGVISAITADNAPVITDLNDRSIRYDITTVIQLTATDSDGDSLSYKILQKPSFAIFTSNNNNTGTLTLNPTSANLGVFNNIQIVVNDNNGGKDTTSFNLTVSSNYDPTIDAISNYTLNENDNVNINLTAHDLNSTDVLTWSVSNVPNAFTLTPGANGTAILNFHPGFASAGTYNVLVTISDGNGGTSSKQFSVTVNDKDPNSTVYVRFKDQDVTGTPWNSITGVTTNNLKDANNNTTSIGLALQTSWFSVWHEGPQTGNNSGIYPDAVLKDYYYFGIFGGPETVTAKLTGLNTSLKYNLTFYAGSVWSGAADNGTTTYSTGSQTVSLYVQNNTNNTVLLNNVIPASDGTITFTMAKGANTPAGYINALVINSVYDDGSAPLTPKSLIAQNNAGQGVQLTWQDLAYNETGYEIYRSVSAAGTYSLVKTTGANASNYTDTSARGNTQYYYKIRSVNTYGQSAYTNIVGILTLDRIPQITPISNVLIKNNETLTVNVTTNDDSADHVSLTASGLPTFVTFTDNGNGTGTLNILPAAGVTGSYAGLTITAKDNSDSSSSTSFSITVIDNNAASVYLNFSDGSIAGKPWNNLTAYPNANTLYSNIVDDNNVPTGITVKLLDGFQGVVASGMRPGNGKGIYPEIVMRTGDYESSGNTKRIQISGLTTAKKYNFVFFNSHDDGLNCLTNFTINGQTVSLNATYNIDKTVQINGISPDAGGNVIISVAKAAGMDYAFINSLIIQSYAPTVFLGPTDLRVINNQRTSLSLQWADRSDSETNYEIWRASDGGSYSLLTTLAANTTSYTDAGLTSNKTYYYQVRAKKAVSVYSNYSNVAAGTTYSSSVYVNFTASNNAPTPWNNTDAPPQTGYTWKNFYDETSAPTSVGMVETGTFAGLYNAGINTGNNSGIFPDKVMIDSYGLFPGQSATIKVTGLNLSMKYNFTFFASSGAYGDVNVAYTVNNKTCLLNASFNKSGTVTMYDIVPDNNGEAIITIAPGTPGSQFGLIGALIIQGYNQSLNSAPAPLLLQGNAIASGASEEIQNQTLQQNISNVQIKAYPNPFINSFNVSVTTKQYEDVSVQMYNMTGKLVYANKFSNLFKGENTLNIQPGTVASGSYIVKLTFSNEKLVKVVKILKQ